MATSLDADIFASRRTNASVSRAERPEFAIDPRRARLPIHPDQCSVQIQTVTSCNATCTFCPHHDTWGSAAARRMDERTFDRILEQVAHFPLYKVAPYLQSEPLTDPRIFDFIGRIGRALRFDVIEVSTNPAILTPRLSARLVAAVAPLPHEIRVSFHGIDTPSFTAAMGIPFEASLRNVIGFLREAEGAGVKVVIKALGARRGAVRGVATLFDEDDFRRFWRRVCDDERLDFERLELRYGAYHNRSDNVHRIGMIEIVRPDLAGFSCSRADAWFHFLWNGDLVLCCNDYRTEVVLGNVVQHDLAAMLKSETYRAVVEQVTGIRASAADFICKRCTSPGG